ncbi:MAG: CDP-alcohol phosphatidyltransferase family protein [Deltaproteobacteria bacterium]|nr:CDP-alcohol phosphatidyltransferase family protein [Deltaproteobacteria bacterium]
MTTTTPPHTAIVICPAGDGAKRKLLGLTLGERVLLALSFSGVKQVAFVGPGTRPTSKRAAVGEVALAAVPREGTVLVTTSDAVFDRQMITADALPSGLPLARVPASDLDAFVGDLDGALLKLGQGVAESGRGFALRVVDRASAARAHRSLLLSLRKPIDGFISRNLNRYMSLFCSSLLVRTGITPNMVTISIGCLGLVAAFMVGQGQPWWMLALAGLLFQVQSVLDGCDGEIARLTYTFSDRGQWLDTVGDDVTNYAFCFGLAYGQAVVLGRSDLMAFGALTLAVQVAMSFLLYRRMIRMGIGDLMAIPDTVTGKASTDGPLGKLLKAAREATRRDTFILIIATLTALQMPLVAFFAFALGTYPAFIAVVINERRLSSRDRAAAAAV